MLTTVPVRTKSRAELVEITGEVRKIVRESGVKEGFCLLYVPHTTAGLLINENADPAVGRDILEVLDRLVPWEANYHHREGNAAAHVKSVLVGVTKELLIREGELLLGTWQGIFFSEFDGPRQRRVYVFVGSKGA